MKPVKGKWCYQDSSGKTQVRDALFVPDEGYIYVRDLPEKEPEYHYYENERFGFDTGPNPYRSVHLVDWPDDLEIEQ